MRKSKPASASKRLTVPRDADAGDDSKSTPTPPRRHSTVGKRARVRGSLEPDSPPARALHEHPPRGRGQLDVGTGGDAARPGKTGIAPTSIQPRGNYGAP
jgi:hypothetical protein